VQKARNANFITKKMLFANYIRYIITNKYYFIITYPNGEILMYFKEFSYNSLDDVKKDTQLLGLDLPFSDKLKLLSKKVEIDGFTTHNSLAYHPMEGCDSEINGAPGELTFRRYERFAQGGAGLIWIEAVSVVPEGRANPRQLWINKENLPEFQKLHKEIIKNSQEKYGEDFKPLCIVQLTHSGRYSRPVDKPAPILAAHNPYIDPIQKIDKNMPVITDEELEALEEKFVEAALLVKEAGFDGVDVKACHRYLNSELLSAFTRKGKYGETFEGRTRFLLNTVTKIKARIPN